jgi:hypothetical protein
MKRMEAMEWDVLSKGHYENYNELRSNCKNDSVRYAMAIAHCAKENDGENMIAFLGGIGVLGNLVNFLGEGVIPKWRGTHDVDMLLKDRRYEGCIANVFDCVDTHAPSLSIPDKMTIRGSCYDLDDSSLTPMAVDVYHPKGHPKEGIYLSGQVIDEKAWDRALNVNFFSIPMKVLNPLDLLGLKLKVICANSKIPRAKDIEDIYHLYATAQRLGYSPERIVSELDKKSLETLARISPKLKNFNSSCSLLQVSPSYLGAVK